MAKTPMRENTRETIFNWMVDEYNKKHANDLDKPLNKAVVEINKAIRKKYPEADMVILRKYKCTRVDSCLKFTIPETGRFFGIDFYDYSKMLESAGIADLPQSSGCNSNDVFPVPEKSAIIIESFISARKEMKDTRDAKLRNYKSFLAACKTVDEFNETVPLPEDLKRRFLAGGALIALNPETIATIKNDFKK